MLVDLVQAHRLELGRFGRIPLLKPRFILLNDIGLIFKFVVLADSHIKTVPIHTYDDTTDCGFELKLCMC